jgi:cell wall-associated NlpC family hydrolase
LWEVAPVEVRRHLPRRRLRRVLATIAVAPARVLPALAGATPASQDTVLRQARAGLSATRILQRSFPGTSVTRRTGATLRVLVADLAPQVVVGPADPGSAPITFLPEPGTPLPVAAAPARPIAGASTGQGPAAVRRTLGQIGVPYRWGGSAPGGFDCSGLVYWAYRQLGITLPRVAEDQAQVGVPVAPGDLQPGDVVFFADSSGYVHHESSTSAAAGWSTRRRAGESVRIERIDVGSYARQYAGARRYSAIAP